MLDSDGCYVNALILEFSNEEKWAFLKSWVDTFLMIEIKNKSYENCRR